MDFLTPTSTSLFCLNFDDDDDNDESNSVESSCCCGGNIDLKVFRGSKTKGWLWIEIAFCWSVRMVSTAVLGCLMVFWGKNRLPLFSLLYKTEYLVFKSRGKPRMESFTTEWRKEENLSCFNNTGGTKNTVCSLKLVYLCRHSENPFLPTLCLYGLWMTPCERILLCKLLQFTR